MLRFYKRLIEMRRTQPALARPSKDNLDVFMGGQGLLLLRRWRGGNQVLCVMNFNRAETTLRIDMKGSAWRKVIDSAEQCWGGPGSSLPEIANAGQELTCAPLSFVLFES